MTAAREPARESSAARNETIGIYRVRTTEREEFYVLARSMREALALAEAWQDNEASGLRGYVDLIEWVNDPVNAGDVAFASRKVMV